MVVKSRPLASTACVGNGCREYMVRVDDRWVCRSGLHWRLLEDVDGKIQEMEEEMDALATWYADETDPAKRESLHSRREEIDRALRFWNAVRAC